MKAFGYFGKTAAGGAIIAQQNKAFQDYCVREGLTAPDTFAETVPPNGRAPGFRELVAPGACGRRRRTRRRAPGGRCARCGAPRTRSSASSSLRRSACASRAVEWRRAERRRATVGPGYVPDDGDSLSDRVGAAMRRKAVKGEVLGRPPYGYKVGSRQPFGADPRRSRGRPLHLPALSERAARDSPDCPAPQRGGAEDAARRRTGAWSAFATSYGTAPISALMPDSASRVPGSHPQLVSAEDFRTVQDRLNARRTSYAPRVASQFLLSGLAQCGYCGNKLIGVSRKQSWTRRDGQPDVQLLPVLPVRVTDEPERLRLPHAAGGISRG